MLCENSISFEINYLNYCYKTLMKGRKIKKARPNFACCIFGRHSIDIRNINEGVRLQKWYMYIVYILKLYHSFRFHNHMDFTTQPEPNFFLDAQMKSYMNRKLRSLALYSHITHTSTLSEWNIGLLSSRVKKYSSFNTEGSVINQNWEI